MRKPISKLLFSILVVGILLVSGFSLFQEDLFHLLAVPAQDFTPPSEDSRPEYSNEDNWLALPTKKDTADWLLEGEVDNQSQAKADVFFVHPTTYFAKSPWNDPLSGHGKYFPTSNTLRDNATVFNKCCRIYAPVYRQMAIGGFMGNHNQRLRSLDFAYKDVERAFDFYLKHYNNGRPIILSSQSQGTDHIVKLLIRRFSGKPLRKKLISAWLLGRPITKQSIKAVIPDIPICSTLEEVGCINGWMTFARGYKIDQEKSRTIQLIENDITHVPGGEVLCTNPTGWRSKDQIGTTTRVHVDEEGQKLILKGELLKVLCEDGGLRIEPAFYYPVGSGKNYHVFDSAMFYKSIRENANIRTDLWFELNNRLQK